MTLGAGLGRLAAAALAGLALLMPARSAAQRIVVKWDAITVEDGLSQDTVRAIVQDRRGFLWLGTADGLNRWDGYEFVVHRHDPSDPATLPANDVACLFEDASGRLWAGTAEGVAWFDHRQGSFVTVRDDARTSPRGVCSIAQAGDGSLWFAGESGVWRLPAGASALQRSTAPGLDGEATALAAAPDGTLWVGCPDGLHRVDPAAGTAQRAALPGIGSVDGVQALLVDAVGDLWIGTRSSLVWWKRGEDRAVALRCDPADDDTLCGDSVLALCRSDGNLIYAATRNGVARIIPKGDGTVRRFFRRVGVPHTLGDGNTLSLCIDRSRNLWVGTAHGGANRLDLKEGRFPHYVVNRAEPGRNSVTSLMPDEGGTLWVGTEEDGLFHCRLESNEIVQYASDPADPESISPGRVSATCEGSGGVWAATGGVLNFKSPDAGGFERSNPQAGEIACMARASAEGRLWLGTERGLRLFDEPSRALVDCTIDGSVAEELVRESVTAILDGGSGSVLWVGTERRGLFRYDPRSGRAVRFAHTGGHDGIAGDGIVSLFADSRDRLWIGTRTGLSMHEPSTGAFRSWRRGDGLANETICGILEDGSGRLWLGTYGGLSRMEADGSGIHNYDAADGLQGSQFNARAVARTADGELFFGGFNGFNAFFPGNIVPNTQPPPIAITGFRVFDALQKPREDGPLSEEISVAGEIRLPWRDNVLAFEFAALDFTAPSRNRYAYMLEGFDKDWVQSEGRRLAMYTNLAGGDYVFRVRGTNSSGVWNEQGASVRLRIAPPFWQTTAFRVSVPLAVLVAVSGGWAVRLRRAEKRERELERLVDERTAALAGSEARFRTLFEGAPVAVAILRDGRWLHFNPAFRTLFGYQSAEELLAVPFDACCARESREAVPRSVFAAEDAIASFAADRVLAVRRDGTCFPLQLVGSRIDLPDGPALALFCIDLAEIEKARETLERYARELEERNREVKQFAYIVSHDLKAPLVNLQGFASELDKAFLVLRPVLRASLAQLDERTRHLVETAANEDVPESLSFIRSSVARMEALVTALLNLSRIGRRDLAFESLDSAAIVRNCLASLAHMIDERGATVRVSGMPTIVADRTAMEQVFGNLLTNAVLYLDPGRRGEIDVWGALEGDFAVLHVKDNGRGIAENEMDKVFAPFRRAGKQDVPGEGMGLAYVRALVRRHGGTIVCQSKPGVGTQMTVSLPIAAGARGEESVA